MIRKPTEHQNAFGLSLRQEAQKQFSKTLLSGSLLFFAHLLGVSPAEVETLGLKITIPSALILYGAISLLYLHFLFRSLSYATRGTQFLRLSDENIRLQSYVLAIRSLQKGKSPTKIKNSVRQEITFYNIIMTPYYVCVTIILLAAFVLSLFDLYLFLGYLQDNSVLLKKIVEVF